MHWLTVYMLAMSGVLGAGTWWYLLQQEGVAGDANGRPGRPAVSKGRKGRRTGTNLKDFWEVQDIREGVLALSGNRYRVVCRLAAADFWLLGEAEQNAVEDSLRGALMQISFPVQFLITSEAVDTRAAVEDLRVAAAKLPGALAGMAQSRAEWLAALMQEKAASARQAYLVVPYDTSKGFEHAAGELWARVTSLTQAMAAAKIRTEPLSSEAIADLLAHLLNRGRGWRPSLAVEQGAMCLYHVGERQVRESAEVVGET